LSIPCARRDRSPLSPHDALPICSVGEINALLDLSQSALSQHLAVLRSEGLVRARRDGQNIYYTLVPGPAAEVMRTLHAIYCGPRSEEHTSELQSREKLVCRPLLE